MLLFIVRHGDPIYDPDSLTEKGKMQAEALVKRFTKHGLDKIYSSPLIRARQTAQPTANALGLPVNIEEWTSEALAYKDFHIQGNEDKSWGWAMYNVDPTELYNDSTASMYENWAEIPRFERTNVKEGYKRIADASDEFLARHGYERQGAAYIAKEPNEERVAVFCHEGFGITWLSHLLSVPPHIFWSHFTLAHSGVSVIEFKDYGKGLVVPRLLCHSDMSHILCSDMEYEYANRVLL